MRAYQNGGKPAMEIDIDQRSGIHHASGASDLAEVERRVLWLATSIVHHANRVRPNPTGLKVGGHQASSASMVSLMTSLWFSRLQAADRVSVKPPPRRSCTRSSTCSDSWIGPT